MDENITIEQLRPKDRKGGYPLNVPRWYIRLFEILPGLVTWLFILSPFILTLLGLTEVLILHISFLTIYWSYRCIRFLYGLIVGTERMKKERNTDWVGKINELSGEEGKIRDNLKYVFVCPIVKEGMDILKPSLDAWADSDIGSKKISLVMAMEEVCKEECMKNYQKILELYKDKFKEIKYYVHPKNIAGEVAGVKGANINWATRHFVDEIKSRGENVEDYLLITCDSDLRPHPKYLSAITYKYLTNPKRNQRFFATAVHTFNNNIWRVPPIIRVQSMVLTIVILHDWVVRKRARDTFSSYVVNLKCVECVHFWDPEIGIDDTTFYWNSLVRFQGDFSGEEVYVPTYSDAVENATLMRTHISLYKQQLRWGWGIIVFPLTFAALYKNKAISRIKKLSIAWHLIDNQLLFLTVIYSITFALPILNLINPEYRYSSASYNLPVIMSYIFTGLMFLNLPIIYLRRKITPIPKGWNPFRHLYDMLETGLIVVNMLTFAFIPFVQAQSELLFGRGFRKKYYTTEKVKIKK
jgi:hypothetical protein